MGAGGGAETDDVCASAAGKDCVGADAFGLTCAGSVAGASPGSDRQPKTNTIAVTVSITITAGRGRHHNALGAVPEGM